MANRVELYKSKRVSATGPTDASEWMPVGQWARINANISTSAASGTNPRMEVLAEFTDDRASTTTSGSIKQVFLGDFFDQVDDVLVEGIPIHGQFARVQRTVSGTSPVWVLEVGVTLYD